LTHEEPSLSAPLIVPLPGAALAQCQHLAIQTDVLAYLRDGKPPDDKAGRYRIVIPEEKRMAHWVRRVRKLKIVDVQQDSVL
jgi:hypothetical protein